MSSSADLIAAAQDADLRARMVALLAASGHSTAEAAVAQRLGHLVATIVSDDGQTIADILAFARANYQPPPPPGADPSAVTDVQIRAALTELALLPGAD